MSGPSDKAVSAAIVAGALAGVPNSITLRASLDAAHKTALGLDRSVCLHDVVESLRGYDDGTNHDYAVAAGFIEREFGAS